MNVSVLLSDIRHYFSVCSACSCTYSTTDVFFKSKQSKVAKPAGTHEESRAMQHDGITRGCCASTYFVVVVIFVAAAAIVFVVVKCVYSFLFVLVYSYVSDSFVIGTRTVFNQHVNKQLLNTTELL